MYVEPFTIHSALERSDLLQYECSDRILLPQSFATEMMVCLNDLLVLTNSKHQCVYGTFYGTHTDDPTVIYIPSWMVYSLDILHSITVAHLPKTRCSALQLQPHSAAFRNHPNFYKLLNTALFNYRSITQKQRIPLLVENKIEYLTIEGIYPEDISTCFVYNCGKVDIQIVEPLENEKPVPSYLFNPRQSKTPIVFIGPSRMLGGGMVPTRIPPQKAAADAAKKRCALIAAGKKTY